MEDLQSNSFIVKSNVHDYFVSFDLFEDNLMNILTEKDIIIIDYEIYKRFPSLHSHPKLLYINAYEDAKEYSTISYFIESILESGFKRDGKIIAIGGGVIQDISGFIASIIYRGVQWVFYPTTLLAQGDSCIGGKSSINVGNYKNQLGGFYPPNQIIIDTNFLKTLPIEQLTSGLGEMAHYFLIEGGEHLDFFKMNHNKAEAMEDIIRKSLMIKKKMIEIDEFDKGPRIIFNYGHSFGHALESVSKYRIPHGISVAYGMDMANYISYKLGYVSNDFVDDSHSLVEHFFGDADIKNFMIDNLTKDSYICDEIIPALKRDKKNKDNKIGLILTRGYGHMFLEQISPNQVSEYLMGYVKERYEKS